MKSPRQVVGGSSELMSFPKALLAAQQSTLQATQTGAASPGQKQQDNISSLLVRKHGVRIQSCSPNPPSAERQP